MRACGETRWSAPLYRGLPLPSSPPPDHCVDQPPLDGGASRPVHTLHCTRAHPLDELSRQGRDADHLYQDAGEGEGGGEGGGGRGLRYLHGRPPFHPVVLRLGLPVNPSVVLRHRLPSPPSPSPSQNLSGGGGGLSIAPANLAACMIEVYSQVRTAFTASDQPHYQFTPRDLTQWVAGLRRYDYESIRWEGRGCTA